MVFYAFSYDSRDLGIQTVLDLDRVPLGKGLWRLEKENDRFWGKVLMANFGVLEWGMELLGGLGCLKKSWGMKWVGSSNV